MAWNFEQLIMRLEYIGLADVILPFILIFTLVFAALQKSHILGEDSKRYNVIIAIVMGFAVVIPHVMHVYPPNADVVTMINSALPNVSLVIVAIVMVMLILGIIGGDVNFAGTTLGGVAIWASIIAVAIIFMAAGNVFRTIPYWLRWTLDPYIKEIVVIILVFGIIIWFITKDDKPNKDKNLKAGKALQDLSSGLWGGNKK